MGAKWSHGFVANLAKAFASSATFCYGLTHGSHWVDMIDISDAVYCATGWGKGHLSIGISFASLLWTHFSFVCDIAFLRVQHSVLGGRLKCTCTCIGEVHLYTWHCGTCRIDRLALLFQRRHVCTQRSSHCR
ncbi:hypothetical protein EJ02DRAFT_25845 [Clathrospora elynae]|uniref:Uncharacterized protein n=1 Tax=Clathrospora elynae TaxID=706981 RepID=A0A6A5SZU1_9PLEO|nr:hypothetical protein EJ02DRAFT_25845 [Clathrospora elynae]